MSGVQQRDVIFSAKPYSSPYTSVGVERVDNFYCEFAKSNSAKQQYYFVGIQGLHASLNKSAPNLCRGMFTTASGRTFGVWGTALVELTNSASMRVTRGQILTTSGIVRFAENGTQMILVDGSYGYILDLLSNAWNRITDEAFPGVDDPTLGPSHVVSVDTHFIVNQGGTKNYFWSSPGYIDYAFNVSAPNVYSHWNGINYGTKLGDNDTIVALASIGNLLLVFGSRSLEFHRNTGDTKGQLFARIDNALANVGCVAPGAVAVIGDFCYFLGSDSKGTIGLYRVGMDFQAVRISERGYEARWQSYESISDAYAYSYAVDGHQFINFVFPHGTSIDGGAITGATWAYDATSETCTRRTSYNALTGVTSSYQGIHAAYNRLWNMVLMGDKAHDAVYWLDNAMYENDDGVGGKQTILGVLSGPVAYDSNRATIMRAVVLNHQPGYAPRTGDGSDPKWALQVSRDSGNTWGKITMRSAGSIAQYRHQTLWALGGSGRNVQFLFWTTDPFKRVVLGYTIRYEQGRF